jgi:fumarylacetoacetate (FAA) hydrolase
MAFMKLATLRDGSRDGTLIVVSPRGDLYTHAAGVAPTMQWAIDHWADAEPRLRALERALVAGRVPTHPVEVSHLGAPLPRAYEWVDGSAYLNHVRLVRKARGAEPPATLETDPLVYQGGSGVLLGPTDDIPLVNPAWGLDFESEVCVIVDDTPIGTTADRAAEHVKLVMLANDVTLRNLIPDELAKGFGFFCSKPATAFSPFAVTPDALGDAWRGGRLHQRVRSIYNGDLVGDTEAGPEMHFSFYDLIAHITRSRAFTAGTLIGSGTVSNVDRSRGVSCLAERRTIETIETGKPVTPFMKVGDTITIESLDALGRDVFGRISQKVVSG